MPSEGASEDLCFCAREGLNLIVHETFHAPGPGAPSKALSWRQRPAGVGQERRVTVIWALLFFNAMPWIGLALFPLPYRLTQLFTMALLGVALCLAVGINPRLELRPNLVLALFSALAAVGLFSSVRGDAGFGAILRSGRLLTFLAVLWLLTPWWGRRDLVMARSHLKVLVLVLSTVIAGIVVAPSLAFGIDGRLAGVVWPIWPTAVAHYAAMAAGFGIVLWLAGSLSGYRALLLGGGGLTMVLLTQTRLALLALVLALAWAALTLVTTRRRVRRVATIALTVIPVALLVLAPAVSEWFTRGQTSDQLANLSGRKEVWSQLVAEPRSELTQWLGAGLTDKSFGGRSIDNSWLAIYHDQGLVGLTLVAAMVLSLLVKASMRPAGPRRALAVFIVVYSVIHSYTEVGLGDASTYLLDLIVAASVLSYNGGTATLLGAGRR